MGQCMHKLRMILWGHRGRCCFLLACNLLNSWKYKQPLYSLIDRLSCGFTMSDIDLYQCFNKQRKDYLVSVTVFKAKNLNVLNADTFVAVTFNDETKKTKIFNCSDSPFFNEVRRNLNFRKWLLNFYFIVF